MEQAIAKVSTYVADRAARRKPTSTGHAA